MAYTAIQQNTQTNFRYALFYGGLSLGVLANADLTFNADYQFEDVTSSLYGESPIAQIYKGGKITAEVTIQEYNKNTKKAIYASIIGAGSTATNATTPFDGTLIGNGVPFRQTGQPLVIYPFYTDESGNVIADTVTSTLKTAIVLEKAVVSSGLNMVMNPTTPYGFTVTFQGLLDVTTGRNFVIDDGITSAGVYTA